MKNSHSRPEPMSTSKTPLSETLKNEGDRELSARARELELENARLRRELKVYQTVVGSEMFTSDFQTCDDLRRAYNALRDELDAKTKAIEGAPHEQRCAVFWERDCDCWKSTALREPTQPSASQP